MITNGRIENHGGNRPRGNPQWVKGQSGNPNGRPKKVISLTSELKAQLGEVCPTDDKGRTWLQVLVECWLKEARDNPAYFKELVERVEGKVTQPIGGENGKPLKVEIIVQSEAAKKLTQEILNGKGTDA